MRLSGDETGIRLVLKAFMLSWWITKAGGESDIVLFIFPKSPHHLMFIIAPATGCDKQLTLLYFTIVCKGNNNTINIITKTVYFSF